MSETTSTQTLPALAQIALQTVTTQVEEANTIAQEVASSGANANKLVHDLRNDDETEDEQIKKFQTFAAEVEAKLEAAREQIDAYIVANHLPDALSEDEVAERKVKYDGLKKSVREIGSMLKAQEGYSDEWLADVPAMLSFSGRKSGGGGGTGTKRPRLASVTVNGDEVTAERKNKAGETEHYVNFTVLANELTTKDQKVSPRDLQEAAFTAAGTDDLSTVSEVSFNFTVGEENYEINVFPRQAE